ncbi:hypothetical protein EZS27_028622 [termite gut metagenome]|uniref:Uncharacterized protein n=1 Tax=termite gut metagenome TaxID=433724 RepID=A0A5J4QLF3_9ZZZZ
MKTHFFKHVLLGMVAIAGFSAVVMLLWNALVPAIFGLIVINFWQALGLHALARLLFGGLGDKMTFGRHGGGGFGKNPIREKWEKMTPEERNEFIKKRKGFEHSHRHDFFGAGGIDFETNNEPKKDNE